MGRTYRADVFLLSSILYVCCIRILYAASSAPLELLHSRTIDGILLVDFDQETFPKLPRRHEHQALGHLKDI